MYKKIVKEGVIMTNSVNFECGIIGNKSFPKTSTEVLKEVEKEREILREAELNQKEKDGTLTNMEKVDLAFLKGQRLVKVLTTPTVIYASESNGAGKPAFWGLFGKKTPKAETPTKSDTDSNVKLVPATPKQKAMTYERIKNLEGLTDMDKEYLYNELTSLPAKCLSNFLVSDDSGNYYVPNSLLVKLARGGYTIEPELTPYGINGGHITLFKKGDKMIGGIDLKGSFRNDPIQRREMLIVMNGSSLSISDYKGKGEAKYRYKVNGVIDIDQAGKLSEIQ